VGGATLWWQQQQLSVPSSYSSCSASMCLGTVPSPAVQHVLCTACAQAQAARKRTGQLCSTLSACPHITSALAGKELTRCSTHLYIRQQCPTCTNCAASLLMVFQASRTTRMSCSWYDMARSAEVPSRCSLVCSAQPAAVSAGSLQGGSNGVMVGTGT
jgi:hypothetical protein